MKPTIVQDKEHLNKLIKDEINLHGDISNWNVEGVKYMMFLFSHSQFNSDVSKWHTSNVGMFQPHPQR